MMNGLRSFILSCLSVRFKGFCPAGSEHRRGLKCRTGDKCGHLQTCPGCEKCVFYRNVNATMTDLRRKTTKVVRPVISGRGKVTITEHGEPCLEIIAVPRVDRAAALAALRAIGPVAFGPRS